MLGSMFLWWLFFGGGGISSVRAMFTNIYHKVYNKFVFGINTFKEKKDHIE